MAWEVLIGPGVFVIVMAIVVSLIVVEHRRLRALGAALAAHGFVAAKGVAFEGGVKGDYKGRRAAVRHRKLGKNGPWTTQVRLAIASPEGFRFRADQEDIGTAIIKAFGGEDVVLGDAAFDHRFRVRTNDPDRVTFALTPEARASLVDGTVRRIEAGGREVLLETYGKEWEPSVIASRLAFLETMAVRLEATR
ncbi:MAG TPA: hypothetical protein VM889_03705 [Candidatus Thermoplasmatota archaeon]|nr:hypothetical protein [Candidatus Thermoplasmatota archaeon]